MPQQQANFGALSQVGRWGPSPYSDGIGLPSGRTMANGSRAVYITHVGAYVVAHYSSYRNVTLRLGAASTGNIVLPVSNSANIFTGWHGVNWWLVQGGTTRFTADSGTWGIGYGYGGGGQTVELNGSRVVGGTIAGAYLYVEAPSEPRNVSAQPTGTAGQVNVYFSGPADDGGTGITDYVVQWATDAGFTQNVGTTTNVSGAQTINGLQPTTYYFRVFARNAVTNGAGTWGPPSGTVSAQVATVPAQVTGASLTPGPDLVHVAWTAPGNGGAAITKYELQLATNNTFTTGLQTLTLDSSARSKTIVDLAPATAYYGRVRAVNPVGNGAYSATVSGTTEARTFQQGVNMASVMVSDGVQVEVRSSGATTPVLTLGYSTVTGGTTFTNIGVLPVNGGPGTFKFNANLDGLALAADADGNIFVVGSDAADPRWVLVRRYARTASTTWLQQGAVSVYLGAGEPLRQWAAEVVPGTGPTGFPTLFVMGRRAGTTGSGNLVYATMRVTNIAASSTDNLAVQQGSDPNWLPVPGSTGTPNGSKVDVTAMVANSTRLAIGANGFAVVDVVNGAVSGVSKSADSTTLSTDKMRVVPISNAQFVRIHSAAGVLRLYFLSPSGSTIGQTDVPSAYAQSGFTNNWDAFFDRQAQVVTINYVADDSGRKLEQVQVSPATYTLFTPSVLSTTLGAVSSVNSQVRLPHGVVDERKVVVTSASNAAGVQSLGVFSNTTGNVPPTAPSLNSKTVFDGNTAQTFTWVFGDPNMVDAQSAYEMEFYRTDTGASVLATGKVVSTDPSRTLASAALADNLPYRWRVRTYDLLDAVGSWSNYSTFETSDAGTVAITSPASDNPVSDTNYQDVVWSYTNTGTATQSRYRVVVKNHATGDVLQDFGWRVGSQNNFRVTNLRTDLEQRVEVQVESTKGLQSTVGTRRLTPSFGLPMTPTFILEAFDGFNQVVVTNPTPSGSRPEVITNEVWKRKTGSGDAFNRVAKVPYNGTYRDFSVASNAQYDYFVRGVSEDVM